MNRNKGVNRVMVLVILMHETSDSDDGKKMNEGRIAIDLKGFSEMSKPNNCLYIHF